MDVDSSRVSELCRDFLDAETFHDSVDNFNQLCKYLGVDRSNHEGFYDRLKNELVGFSCVKKAFWTRFWSKIDARKSHKEYNDGNVGKDKRVLVIGAGPCGLRMAIECAFLGAKVIVIEMRDYISRNNVLHLWPFVIEDMISIGAKEFYPKFATGNLNHVSIRKTQLMLMKVALILGVEIHAPVRFIDLIEPQASHGWKVAVTPDESIVNNLEFHSVIGANGARNCLRGFKRKNPFRAKLAIAITANFVNRNTMEDVRVEEIPGIFSFMNPEFFGVLKSRGFDLENFVYYKDDTHYFVMTVKKHSLLQRGVLKQDFADPATLMQPQNIDKIQLRDFAREVAQITTANQIPRYEYAKTHTGEDDVAVFDFTEMYQSENAVMAREVDGQKLLTTIIGDSLINPFWPRGTGCAHGFLGVLDTAWMLKSWWEGVRSDAEILCERESIFSLLSQTNPSNLNKDIKKYTIDPKSRYGPQLVAVSRKPQNMSELYRKGRSPSIGAPKENRPLVPKPAVYSSPVTKSQKRSRGASLDTHRLLSWYQKALNDFSDVVKISDLNDSWRDGMGLCSLLTLYRPELIDVRILDKTNIFGNSTRAFELIEREFGVSPMLNPAELASSKSLDRLGMLSYLACLHEELLQESMPSAKTRKLEELDKENYSSIEEYISLTLPRDPKAMIHYMTTNEAVAKSMSLDRNMLKKKKPKEKKKRQVREMYNAVRKIYMQGYKLSSAAVEQPPKKKERVTAIPEEADPALRPPPVGPRPESGASPKPLPPQKPPRVFASGDSGEVPEYKKHGVPLPAIPSQPVVKETKPKPEPSYPLPARSQSPKPGVNNPVRNMKEELMAGLSDEEQSIQPNDEEEFWRRKTSSIKACRGLVQSRMGVFGPRVSPKTSPLLDRRDRAYTAPVKPSEQTATEQNIRRSSSPFRPVADNSPQGSPRRFGGSSPSPASSPVVKRRQKKELSEEEKRQKEEKRLSVKEMLSKYEENVEGIRADAEKNTPASQTQTSDGCCICQQRLYLIDRHAAHGLFFHRHCYKCYTCETQLRLGSSIVKKLPDGSVQFYCMRHGFLSGALEAEWEKDESDARTDILKELQKHEETTDPTTDYSSMSAFKETKDCKYWEPSPGNTNYEYFMSMQEQLQDVDSEDDAEENLYEEINYDAVHYDESDSDDGDDYVTADYEPLRDYMTSMADMMGTRTGSAYQSTASLRLYLGDTIQRGIEEVEQEEQELEQIGLRVERSIRGERQSVVEDKPEDELMDDFLDVMQKKKELSDKESKLTLQMMLMELEERHIRLKAQLAMMEPTPEMIANVKALNEDTSDLELQTEMAQVSKGLTDLKVYLGHSGETKA